MRSSGAATRTSNAERDRRNFRASCDLVSLASVVLVDRRNFHLFQPLLYQVATAELEPSNIAAPLRQIFASQKNVDIALGEITSINLDQKTVEFDGGECSYDYLVIATGMRQSYYGHDEYEQFAPGLKSN